MAHPTGQPAAVTPICKHQDLFFVLLFFSHSAILKYFSHCKTTFTFSICSVEHAATRSGNNRIYFSFFYGGGSTTCVLLCLSAGSVTEFLFAQPQTSHLLAIRSVKESHLKKDRGFVLFSVSSVRTKKCVTPVQTTLPHIVVLESINIMQCYVCVCMFILFFPVSCIITPMHDFCKEKYFFNTRLH